MTANIRNLIETKLTALPFLLGKQRTLQMFQIAFGILSARAPRLGQIASHMNSDGPKLASVEQNIYNFFRHAKLDTRISLFYVLALAAEYADLFFAMDRSSWKFRGVEHNYLVISLLVSRMAIPVAVLPLGRQGNAGDAACIKLLKRLFKALPPGRRVHLVADREFVGKDLRQFLDNEGIHYVVRLRVNQVFTINGVKTKIGELYSGKGRGVWAVDANGDRVFIKTYFAKGQWVALASNFECRELPEMYARRWKIEVGFQALKKRGINLEETGLKAPERLEKLILVCGLALALCAVAARLRRLEGDQERKNRKGEHRKSEVKFGKEAIAYWSRLSTSETIELFFRYLNLFFRHYILQRYMAKPTCLG